MEINMAVRLLCILFDKNKKKKKKSFVEIKKNYFMHRQNRVCLCICVSICYKKMNRKKNYLTLHRVLYIHLLPFDLFFILFFYFLYTQKSLNKLYLSQNIYELLLIGILLK